MSCFSAAALFSEHFGFCLAMSEAGSWGSGESKMRSHLHQLPSWRKKKQLMTNLHILGSAGKSLLLHGESTVILWIIRN